MTDFIKKWCNSEYFDSRENPAEEMAKDLQAAIAQAVKEERERIIGVLNDWVTDRGLVVLDFIMPEILEAEND